jgi:hypothetical protein
MKKGENDDGSGIKFYLISMEIQKRCKSGVLTD